MSGLIAPASGVTRRRLALAAVAAPCAALAPGLAVAGRQVEEPLADSVRSVLSAAIANNAPPKPSFENFQDRIVYLRWLGEMSNRLKKRKSENVTRIEFLETVYYEAKRAGLEPALLLGLIQVESGFRKYAISIAGARGYTQVMPFWTRLIGDGEPARLFHMQTNLRFGGKPQYPTLVFGAKRAWDWKPA